MTTSSLPTAARDDESHPYLRVPPCLDAMCQVNAAEKRARIKDPPAVVKEAKVNDDEKEYLGKKVTVKLFEQTNMLMTCFDNPERTLETLGQVQERLLRLIPLDPRGRVMFDYEKEDTRDEVHAWPLQRSIWPMAAVSTCPPRDLPDG